MGRGVLHPKVLSSYSKEQIKHAKRNDVAGVSLQLGQSPYIGANEMHPKAKARKQAKIDTI